MKDLHLRSIRMYRNAKDERRTLKILGLKSNSSTVGFYDIPLKSGITAQVIADDGYSSSEWEHVSASTKTRCLTWEEMCEIKDIFFNEDEAVIQIHPPQSEYVNNHEYCLHLWRPKTKEIPLPPKDLV